MRARQRRKAAMTARWESEAMVVVVVVVVVVLSLLLLLQIRRKDSFGLSVKEREDFA